MLSLEIVLGWHSPRVYWDLSQLLVSWGRWCGAHASALYITPGWGACRHILVATLHYLDRWEEGDWGDPVKFNKDKCWGLLWKAECCRLGLGSSSGGTGSSLNRCHLCCMWQPWLIPSSFCPEHIRNYALRTGKVVRVEVPSTEQVQKGTWKWSDIWSTSPMKAVWESWCCSAWKRGDLTATFP